MENPARVLIIDTSWLGDAVFTTSLLGSVRTLWPGVKLHVVCSPRGEAVLHAHPMIDNLWVFDKRGKDRGLKGLRRMAAELRPVGFDVILNAHPSFRSRLLTKMIGAPIRVGYSGFGARFCFTQHIPYDPVSQPNHVDRRIALLKALPSSLIPYPLALSPSPLFVPIHAEERTWAEAFLRDHRAAGKPILGLLPGAAWETKRWPLRYHKALAARWVAERDGFVLVFGGPLERELIAGLCAENPSRILSVLSEPLPRVAALLHVCTAVVGGDTGIVYLADAVHGPQVLDLQGCTQPNHPFPWPSRSITAGVPCCLDRAGHGAHRCHWQQQGSYCMEQISVDTVWQALEEGLRDKG